MLLALYGLRLNIAGSTLPFELVCPETHSAFINKTDERTLINYIKILQACFCIRRGPFYCP